jgi:tetratricopeptide (TPR) repeat protein
MRSPCLRLPIQCAGPFLFLLMVSVLADAQKKIPCQDGDHLEIDVKQIAIQYAASSFAGTLSSLSVLGARLEVAPKKLQEAAVATQQWDEFLKGLAAGYNSCAVTRQQYADGLTRIYPRLKEDAASLEEIRKIISDGRKADEKRLQSLLGSYYNNLRSFAQIGGKEVILERIEALSEQVASGQSQILGQQKTDTEVILAKLNELEQKNTQTPLPTPAQVTIEISEIRKNLLAKADDAETAYNKGYELLDRYRFQEAIPYLRQAVAAVPLPDFYLVLGRAYTELPDLSQAEKTLGEGLALVAGKSDEKHEAMLALRLGLVLLAKGDLDGALSYAQRSLKIDERIHGVDHAEVATDFNAIGLILQDKGDLDGALSYAKHALEIDEKAYGSDHPRVAIDANNVGLILQAKGDLDGALNYAQRALKIVESLYGVDYPTVGIYASNIGQILRDKGDLGGALRYTQRALRIDEKVYGADSPTVAIRANNIGTILHDKGDLDGALGYAQRALQIDEKVYGKDHPEVATVADNIGQILSDKGDLDGALGYAQRALKIDEKVFGADHPTVAVDANNIGHILQAKGDLDGALNYTQRALQIDEKVLGVDHPKVAIRANNIGQILQDKGDLDGALSYTQRALKIFENTYGPDNPSTKRVASNLERIKKAMGH